MVLQELVPDPEITLALDHSANAPITQVFLRAEPGKRQLMRKGSFALGRKFKLDKGYF